MQLMGEIRTRIRECIRNRYIKERPVLTRREPRVTLQ